MRSAQEAKHEICDSASRPKPHLGQQKKLKQLQEPWGLCLDLLPLRQHNQIRLGFFVRILLLTNCWPFCIADSPRSDLKLGLAAISDLSFPVRTVFPIGQPSFMGQAIAVRTKSSNCQRTNHPVAHGQAKECAFCAPSIAPERIRGIHSARTFHDPHRYTQCIHEHKCWHNIKPLFSLSSTKGRGGPQLL